MRKRERERLVSEPIFQSRASRRSNDAFRAAGCAPPLVSFFAPMERSRRDDDRESRGRSNEAEQARENGRRKAKKTVASNERQTPTTSAIRFGKASFLWHSISLSLSLSQPPLLHRSFLPHRPNVLSATCSLFSCKQGRQTRSRTRSNPPLFSPSSTRARRATSPSPEGQSPSPSSRSWRR